MKEPGHGPRLTANSKNRTNATKLIILSSLLKTSKLQHTKIIETTLLEYSLSVFFLAQGALFFLVLSDVVGKALFFQFFVNFAMATT